MNMDHMGHMGDMDPDATTGMMMTHDGDHDMSSMGHMMMYFHASGDATVLFEKWTLQAGQAGAWFGTCLAIFIMALLYEGLKVIREILLKRSVVDVRYQSTELSKDSKTAISETHRAGHSRILSWSHVLQAFLHMIQVTVSYFLMLIFMTFNVYLCIPIILGAGLGYFVFGWKRSIVVDVNEHCH